jgi:inosose dehydratase
MIKIGCFALVQPFATMARQFQLIREMGIRNADLTDNHNGGSLGVEYGFTSSISLDSHPERIRSMASAAGVRLSSFCAHANMLDPPSPDVYATTEIIKAIRLAHLLDIRHVITTEGDPKTAFGHSLTHAERLFAIRERLQAPIEWARELGIELLIEPHGVVTSQIESMEELLGRLGNEDVIGVCLDTGNSWLGGSDPLDYVRRFGKRIKHVHWKDMSETWLPQRGSLFGCGMATIPLGDGVVGVRSVLEALLESGFDGDTTLEIAGVENVELSVQRLQEWGAAVAQRASSVTVSV